MNWKINITWFVWLFPLLVWAQTNDKVEEAYILYTQENYNAAADVIDDVVASGQGSKNEIAWHIRGFIYKDLYVESEDSLLGASYREEAVKSFKQSNQLDKKGKLRIQNVKALNYLAITYYNDASDIIGHHDPATIGTAEEVFYNYENLLRYLYPDTVLEKKIIDFYLAMSTAHRKIYESDRERYEGHWDKSNAMFLKVLDIDPQSFKANYSLAVSHYNKGAYNLRKLAVQEDFHDIFAIQGMSMASIRSALPFMLKANEIDPHRIEAVRGLKIIYFNMNKEDQSREFDEREKELKFGEK